MAAYVLRMDMPEYAPQVHFHNGIDQSTHLRVLKDNLLLVAGCEATGRRPFFTGSFPTQ